MKGFFYTTTRKMGANETEKDVILKKTILSLTFMLNDKNFQVNST